MSNVYLYGHRVQNFRFGTVLPSSTNAIAIWMKVADCDKGAF